MLTPFSTVSRRLGASAAGAGRPSTALAVLLTTASLFLSGCGIHYYDAKSGVEHVWGFGHLRMRVVPPADGVQAVIKGYSVLGVKVGGSPDDYGVSVGYDSREWMFISVSNAAFGLTRPDSSLFNVRLSGAEPPFLPKNESPSPSTNQIPSQSQPR